MSWIRFRQIPFAGKTERWEVETRDGVTIGRISWSTGWRRYILQPAFPTEWEQDCLRDIADFIERQTRDYKEQSQCHAPTSV
jgi:hypothetical protein